MRHIAEALRLPVLHFRRQLGNSVRGRETETSFPASNAKILYCFAILGISRPCSTLANPNLALCTSKIEDRNRPPSSLKRTWPGFYPAGSRICRFLDFQSPRIPFSVCTMRLVLVRPHRCRDELPNLLRPRILAFAHYLPRTQDTCPFLLNKGAKQHGCCFVLRVLMLRGMPISRTPNLCLLEWSLAYRSEVFARHDYLTCLPSTWQTDA